MAKISYHGTLGAFLIPLVGFAFLAVLLVFRDNADDWLPRGLAVMAFGLFVAGLGFALNRKSKRYGYRARSRFSAPHHLGHIPVQYFGLVVMACGVALILAEHF